MPAALILYQPAGTYSFPNTFTLPNSTTWTPCFNPSHPDWQAHAEGMVVDPATGTLWAHQELVGLWKLTTELDSPRSWSTSSSGSGRRGPSATASA